jgi:DNA helicase-2/ATP-dependent DNA helicase PcrA
MSILLIDAGPGTGKSFTLNNGYRILSHQIVGRLNPTEEQQAVFDYLQDEYGFLKPPFKVCFFAHNNSTKDNLTHRLPPKTRVQTFHGAGMSAIMARYRYQKLDSTRSEKLISDITGKHLRDMPSEEKFHWLCIKKYVHYLKLENLTPSQESMDYIRMKYPDMSIYRIPDDWYDRSTRLIDKASIINGSIEFVDMLWLGLKSVKQPIYDLGFVDESQDISKCAYHLVTRLCKNVVFCGDKNQAINAFAGASEEMYDNIFKVSDAVLPLKVTLRCPPFICDMANAIRKNGIIPGPVTENGLHETIDYNSLPEKLVQSCTPRNSLIISRTNAAVISCALLLHRSNIPCQIIDKDLADEVRYFFGSFHTRDINKLKDAVDAYEARGVKSKNLMWAQMCSDKAEYARELLNSVSNWNQLIALIEETFEKHLDGYKLSSIHKAKGLEAANIFILNPPIELPAAMAHPVAKEQEINLHFVALTRSSKNLYWVVKKQ